MDEKQPRKSGDTVFPIITLSLTMETSGWIWPNFELIQDLMYVIITCKYEKDSTKTAEKNWRHHFSHYKPMGIFSDFQGQLTLESVVRTGQNSNSSELSCMSSLPASMKRIGWKTGEKKWRHRFLHYNPTDGRTGGCRLDWYTISSLLSLRLRWAKNPVFTLNFSYRKAQVTKFDPAIEIGQPRVIIYRQNCHEQTMIGRSPQCYIPSFV